LRAAFLAAFSVCLLAAAPAFTIVPNVVVYPPAVGSDAIDRDLIAHITTVLATEIGSDGTVKVLAAQPGLDRGRYLADARARGADYYVTGFATQIGSRLSLISQVVGTQSGTVLFSATATVDGDRDVASQGDQLRAGIVERSVRAIQALEATPPPPEPSPSPAATPSPGPKHR
jgi:TolB-like protein